MMIFEAFALKGAILGSIPLMKKFVRVVRHERRAPAVSEPGVIPSAGGNERDTENSI
jgi:hypothetical protein